MGDVVRINLTPVVAECCICGIDVIDGRQAIPMYEGEPVPHDWHGEWAGFTACQKCFEEYEATQRRGE